MSVFSDAIDHIFTSLDFGVAASFHLAAAPPPAAGTPVRILLRQPDAAPAFGDTQILVPTNLIEVRRSEVATPPVAGDIFVVTGTGEVLTVLGRGQTESARLTWVCEAVTT